MFFILYCIFFYELFVFFFFKQKTAYEISSRDWSSDVCSSDLVSARVLALGHVGEEHAGELRRRPLLDPLDATQAETEERALEDRLIEEIVRQLAGRVAVLAD